MIFFRYLRYVRVLVTEDDEDLRIAVEAALRAAGFAVDVAADLPEADEALAVNAYDCVVFDRMLPSGDALEYVHNRRRAGWPVPVLFLTARDAVADRIAGLAIADDYLLKPFAMRELLARVGSVCRRSGAGVEPDSVLRHGDLVIDEARREAWRGQRQLALTGKEFIVLRTLIAAGGRPVHRKDLIAAAWDELVPPTSNVLERVVAQLRRKLGEPPVVVTIRGVGYALG